MSRPFTLPSAPSPLLSSVPFHDEWGTHMPTRLVPTPEQREQWLLSRASPLLATREAKNGGSAGWTRLLCSALKRESASSSVDFVIAGGGARLARQPRRWVFVTKASMIPPVPCLGPVF